MRAIIAILVLGVGVVSRAEAQPPLVAVARDPICEAPVLDLENAPTQFPVRVTDWNVETADINADGTPDMLVAAASGSWLISLVSNGHGGFDSRETAFGVGTNQAGDVSLALADFDGNRTIDAAIYRRSRNDIIMMSNNGAGVFSLARQVAVPNYPLGSNYGFKLAAGDINGDRKADLVFASSRARGAVPLLNTSTISQPFSFQVQPVIATGANGYIGEPNGLLLADLNRDGRLDLIYRQITRSGSYGWYEIGVRLNLGNLNFAPAWTDDHVNNASSLAVADLNGDGYKDIVADSGDIFVYRNLNQGQSFAVSEIDAQRGTSEFRYFGPVALADMDRDGLVDVVAGRQFPSGGVAVFRNEGNLEFGMPEMRNLGSQPTAIQAVDLTRDGYAEIITTRSWGQALIEFFLNTSYCS